MKEIKIINMIQKLAGKPGKGVNTGIGDDCAVLDHDRRKYLLWAADMLVEGTHFRKEEGYERIGRKSVAVNISDIAAMGGYPKYILISLGVPGKNTESIVREFYKGIKKIADEYGVKILGGDLDRSEKLVIDVSIIGFVEKGRLIKRSGAKEGDIVLVTGPVRDGKKTHLDFAPRLKEARSLSGRYRINSMIDVSDGIAPDMRRVCAVSRVGCRIYDNAIPLSKGLAVEDALYFGESFELLFTMAPREARKLFKHIKNTGKDPNYFVIGEITSKKAGTKRVRKDGRVSELELRGFEHF